MIIYKKWTKLVTEKGEIFLKYESRYDGWFLFGFIPLYIRRYAVVRCS